VADPGHRDITESGRHRIDKIWNDLYYGNGKPGVCTRLELLEDAVERTEKVLEKFSNTMNRVVWLIVSGVILAVLNLVIHH
jgi:hypothetical protein